MSLAVLGLDIGGANLKAAYYQLGSPPVAGRASSEPFALWRSPGELAARLRTLITGQQFPFDLLSVTMTGELCDCYSSKREGVLAILGAVQAAATTPVRVWTTQGRFFSLEAALAHPMPVASANWLALAAFAGRFSPGAGMALVIDVGSTTTDIVPLRNGRPVPRGRSDPERLRTGELVYTGVRRTPVCAVVSEWLAAEVFATTLDVYLLLGQLPEGNIDTPETYTADGRPPTRKAADLRLARMLGADLETSTPTERLRLAQTVAARQTHLIASALERVVDSMPTEPQLTILAGEGEFLARAALNTHQRLKECKTLSLAELLGESVSNAACAHAVAVLAAHKEAGTT
jgi:probable H4MPT-linked C1 transfer pathway protein